MAKVYDVVVVGGGPGGYPAALRSAELGLRVALVEGDRVGGVCLHAGCIPTKSLLHVAKVSRVLRHSLEIGFEVPQLEFNFAGAARHRDASVGRLFRGVQGLLRRAGVDVIAGWATVQSRDEVIVQASDGSSTALTARNVIVATGSQPRPFPDVPFDGVRILSSDHAVLANALPESVVIVGAGAIGVEFASLYGDLGVRSVLLVEPQPEILPLEDAEIGAQVRLALQNRGITIETGTSVAEIRTLPDSVATTLAREGREWQVESSAILVAIGRSVDPTTAGLSALGVAFEQGFVAVDGRQRTNVPGVYAVGDLTGGLLLAHKATAEGVIAAEAIGGANPMPLNPLLVPRCTYSYPEVASFGLTEDQARASYPAVRVGRATMGANPRAIVEGDQTGFVKVVAEANSGEILGVHAVGSGVTELIAGPIVAAGLEATLKEVGRAVHPHPTVSEAIAEAALAALHQN